MKRDSNLPIPKKRAYRFQKVTLMKQEIIEAIFKENPSASLSLRKIREKYMERDASLSFSIETLRKFLRKRMKMTFRKPVLNNFRVFQNKCQVQKTVFLKKLISVLKQDYLIIFIDESSFSNHHKSFRKWEYKTARDEVSYPGRMKSISLLCAVSEHEILQSELIEPPIKSHLIKSFIRKLECKKFNYNLGDSRLKNKKKIYFLDNAAIHTSVTCMNEFDSEQIEILFGVPYCASFNMIEYFFEDLKLVFYRHIFNDR